MANKKRKKRALVLFSGGLDSLLALKILENLGFEVTALIFKSAFFDGKKALELAKQYGFSKICRDFSKKHLALVKAPCFGRGKNMNPCIDCHLLMLKAAKKIKEDRSYAVLATGEVLGQRPMSQNKRALELIEKKADLEKKILRPLSAKVLPKTIYEEQGLVLREKLSGIKGKRRNNQLRLAKQLGLSNYSTPSGGCLLTDPEFSKKLSLLFEKASNCGVDEVALLKLGRIFWLKKNLLVIGRHKEDNERLLKFWKSKRKAGDVFLELRGYKGPLGLIKNLGGKAVTLDEKKKTGGLLGWYYPRIRDQRKVGVKVKLARRGKKETVEFLECSIIKKLPLKN